MPKSADVSPRLLTLLSVSDSAQFSLQAADPGQAAKSDDPLPEGKGKDVTKRVCSGCHALSVFAEQRHSEDEWDAILQTMISKGMDASDDDLATVSQYLASYLGPKKQDAPNPPPRF